ncbi:MAG TPA: cupredoxin domain-containing protein [Thermoleophilaceae bacterium]|nr:cupredoxin domain-containing protein [Thermoleophilaceae bacterium]
MTMPLGRILCATGAVLALAGCGEAEEPPEVAAAVSAGKPLTVVAREYLFSPNRVTIKGAPADGTRQRIELENRGELAHNIEILEGDRIVNRLRSFPAGQRRGLTVDLPRGEYRFICTVADHDEKGMHGTLTVR